MPSAFNTRSHQVFLSHASADKAAFVDDLHQWLVERAGLSVWYDRNLYGAAASKIAEGFDDSQSALFVVSRSSAGSDWVEREFNCALAEMEFSEHFRIASIRLDETKPPNFLKTYSHIDACGKKLEPRAAALLLEALFGGSDPTEGKPIYFSRGTRRADSAWNKVVADLIRSMGCRLICDSPDQRHSDQDRVVGLINGCVGLVAVLPERQGATSNYVLAEVNAARELNKPALVFCQEGVTPQAAWGVEPLKLTDDLLQAGRDGIEDAFGQEIARFASEWRQPSTGGHAFIGHSFAESSKELFLPMQRLISRLAGVPVRAGAWLSGRGAQGKIIEQIRGAEFCVIDITNAAMEGVPEKANYGLNSSIEAGAALGAGRPLYITCKGKPRTPPYMFRDMEVLYYETELELIANIRRVCHEHRRFVIR